MVIDGAGSRSIGLDYWNCDVEAYVSVPDGASAWLFV